MDNAQNAAQKKFFYPIKVSDRDIDSLQHVNNEIYIKWLMEAANAHSTALGYGIEVFVKSDECFVVRRHEVDYLAPAFLGDDVVVETWIENMKLKASTRVYEIKRVRDQKILVTAKTIWIYIKLSTGKPIEIPARIVESFKDYIHET